MCTGVNGGICVISTHYEPSLKAITDHSFKTLNWKWPLSVIKPLWKSLWNLSQMYRTKANVSDSDRPSSAARFRHMTYKLYREPSMISNMYRQYQSNWEKAASPFHIIWQLIHMYMNMYNLTTCVKTVHKIKELNWQFVSCFHTCLYKKVVKTANFWFHAYVFISAIRHQMLQVRQLFHRSQHAHVHGISMRKR